MKQKSGFTIIELIIAIFILSIAVIGIFSAFSLMVILASDGADRLTASYLAQEGDEIVRNIRDTNWLAMDAETILNPAHYTTITWLDGLGADSNCAATGCKADYADMTLLPWENNINDFLSINSAGFYNYGDGALTKFKRKLKITPITDYVVKVTVEVSWTQKPTLFNLSGAVAGVCGEDNCIKVEETLYDWYNYTQAITEPPIIEE